MKAKKTDWAGLTWFQRASQFSSCFSDSGKYVQALALENLAANARGADLDVLAVLAQAVVEGKKIDPVFQTVANAIAAKVIISRKLPAKKGRPKNTEPFSGREIAQDYFYLMDHGARHEDAVAQVAAKFFKDERNLLKIVAKNKRHIGNTKDDRMLGHAFHDAAKELNLDFDYGEYEEDKTPDPLIALDDVIKQALSKHPNAENVLRDSIGEFYKPIFAATGSN